MFMRFMRKISVLLIMISLWSCKKHSVEAPMDLGYDYYPTDIGKYVIYNVDSIIYDDFKHDTTEYKYQIKEKLEENYTDNEGRPTIKLVRYIKKYDPNVPYSNMPWVVKDVWAVNKTNSSVQVVEENVRLTKLSFPTTVDASWNGNAFNTMDEWDYQYIYTDRTQTINGTLMNKVLYVQQKDDKNKNNIHRQYYIEKYARGIGLVHREIHDVYSQTVTVQNGQIVPVENRIEKGVMYYQTYVSHGME